MNEKLKRLWDDFCEQLGERCEKICGSDNESRRKLHSRIGELKRSAPESETEMVQKKVEAEGMIEKWEARITGKGRGEEAYKSCENHEPIPLPTETIAEQAEEAKSED